MRSLVELSGIIGPRLSFTLGIGYGFTWFRWTDAHIPEGFSTRPSPDAVRHAMLAHLGLAIRLARTLRLSLGMWHDFRAESGVAEHVAVDTYFMTLTTLPWRRLSLQFTAAYVSRQYAYDQRGEPWRIQWVRTGRPHIDPHLLVRMVADIYALKWLSIGASYQLQTSLYEGPIVIPTPDPSGSLIRFRYPYRVHRIMGRVAVRY